MKIWTRGHKELSEQKFRSGPLVRHGTSWLIIFAACATIATPAPTAAQSVREIIQKNEALADQNKALMDQNRRLMEMIKKNAARIRNLETTAATRSGGAASAPLEKRVKKLETKQSALDKRSGGVLKSGNKNVRLYISGQINRALLMADDGDNTDVFHVDNDNSSSRFRFVGEAGQGNVTAGAVLEVEFESNSTSDISQTNESQSPTLKERKIEIFVNHSDYGKLTLGQGDTASEKTAEVDLSGTSVVSFSNVGLMAGGLLFFDKSANALSSTKIKNVSSNFDGLGRDDRIRYDTPKFYGFSVAASHVSNDKWDLALFHSGKYGAYEVAGAFGYSEPKGAIEDRLDGSISVRHAGGINLTVAGGRDDLKSGDRDPWSWYAKLGYLFDWRKQNVPWMARIGKTALALDYHRTDDQVQNNDEFQSVGFFAVQMVDDWAADIYLGIRWHDLDREGSDFDEIMSLMVGGRVKF